MVLGILVLSLGVLSFLIIDRETRLLSRKNAEVQHALAAVLAQNLRESMLEGRPRKTLSLIRNVEGRDGLERVDILRADGTSLFFPDRPPYRPGLNGVEAIRESAGHALDTAIFPLRNEPACRSCHPESREILGAVLITQSRSDLTAEITEGRRGLAALFAAMIAVTGATLAVLMRRTVLRPLGELVDGAARFGSGEFSHRITVRTNDELHDVAESFNRMAGELQVIYQDMERLVEERTRGMNESFHLMWSIMAGMSGGIMLLGRDGVVRFINDQAAQVLGRRREDLYDAPLQQAAPGASAFAGLEENVPYREAEVTRADGTAVPVGFSVTPFRGGAKGADGLIITLQDLTKMRELQSELVTKERFAAIGRIVAGVAHEVRNPLFAISSIGQIFERELQDPAHLELVRALLSETKRLNLLVEDLLVYGRPMKLREERCDLRAVLEDVLTISRNEIESRGIHVAGDYAVPHLFALVDGHQVRQVFLNLLRNAMEATPAGGSITIRLLLEDRYIIFQFADTGAGIPEPMRDRVFELFFTTKPKGTGMGLAICRKIVEDHGGRIEIDSAEDAGTTVTVRLPYRAA